MTSLERFNEGLAEVRSILKLDPSSQTDLPAPDGAVTHAGDVGSSVRRAAVVLLVSHFEGFLKRICEDMVDSLDGGGIESRRIPRGLREIHIVPKLADVVTCGNEQQRFALLAKLGGVSSLWNDTAKPPKGTLRVDLASRQVHNADSECIDKLFDLFGVKDPVCDGEIDVKDDESDEEETHDIRTRLRDLVKCRNDIAHGDMERRPTSEDVRRYVLFLSAFARRLYRKSCTLIGEFQANAS
jgi:hypothetical protein